MTANLNLMTKHLPPILPLLTRTASRTPGEMEVSSHPVLLEKYRAHCVLCKSNLAQIALVGARIHPQNGQRDDFTREPPRLDTNTFGVPVAINMKLSLTPGFVH